MVATRRSFLFQSSSLFKEHILYKEPHTPDFAVLPAGSCAFRLGFLGSSWASEHRRSRKIGLTPIIAHPLCLRETIRHKQPKRPLHLVSGCLWMIQNVLNFEQPKGWWNYCHPHTENQHVLQQFTKPNNGILLT